MPVRARRFQTLDSVARHYAVFVHKRHEVGDGSERDQIEVVFQVDFPRAAVVALAHFLYQSVRELEDKPHGAQLAPRCRADIVHVRVYENVVVYGNVLRLVVVYDNQIYALVANVFDCFDRVCAAVERNQKRRLAVRKRSVPIAASLSP